MPTLIVLRHAKAVTGLGLADIDRPLAGRGLRDAAAAGDWLRASRLRPDLVLCSTAQRTRETLARLAIDAEVSYEPAIYDNDTDALLDLIWQTPAEVGTLLMIGHNPSFHHLVHDLAGEAPESFPTCAMAVIELTGTWPDTQPGTGRTLALWTPKTAPRAL